MQILLDLALNLFAEGLGIVVTIFVIERILDKREKQRWLPLKQVAAVQLLDITTEIILNLTPKSLLDIKSLSIDSYKFGTNYRHVLMDKKYLLNIFVSSRNILEDEMAQTQNIDSKTLDILSSCEKKITNIIEQPNVVFEPEVMEYAISLRHAVQEVYPSGMEKVMTEPVYNPLLAAISLNQILTLAIYLRVLLIKQSDKVIPAEELSLEMKSVFKDIYAKNKI